MAKIVYRRHDRNEMPLMPPEKRKKTFDEYALGFPVNVAIDEAYRCILCKKAPCIPVCPAELDIPRWIEQIQKGNMAEAYRIIREKSPFGAVCGRVCPQERQCESNCVLMFKDNGLSVSIGGLERFAADTVRISGMPFEEEKAPDTGKKVAVLGAGPAGLSAAYFLAKRGHKVVVYEALPEPGGVMRYGIPPARLDRKALDYEIELIEKLGVEIKTDHVVGKTITYEDLRKEYDAIFIGVGSGRGKTIGVPGEGLIGVYTAIEFLTRINLYEAFKFPEGADTPIPRGKRVVVVGGGFTAVDCLITSLRLDNETHLVYRRTRETSSARDEEWDHVAEEGAILHWLTQPIEIIGNEKGEVVGIKCIKMELVPDEKGGRPKPKPVPNSEHIIECDIVVQAVGQGPNPLAYQDIPGLKIDKWQNLSTVDSKFRTNVEGVFAGGDVVNGGDTVVRAIRHGREAAEAIHEYLMTGKWEYEGEE